MRVRRAACEGACARACVLDQVGDLIDVMVLDANGGKLSLSRRAVLLQDSGQGEPVPAGVASAPATPTAAGAGAGARQGGGAGGGAGRGGRGGGRGAGGGTRRSNSQ